jgi:DNA-binding SARP family transcriptional activator
MTALNRGGGRKEALACYESHRQLIARELGLDPSPVLRDLYASILSGDLADAMPPAAAPSDSMVARSFYVHAITVGFDHALRPLTDHIVRHGRPEPGRARIACAPG